MPQMANFELLGGVSFKKGCYVGQETVARLYYRGKPNRHLRGLRLSGAGSHGDVLRLGEKEVGRLGSVVVSPVHGPIALVDAFREAAKQDQRRGFVLLGHIRGWMRHFGAA